MTTIVISHLQGFKHPEFLYYYSQDQEASGRTVGRIGLLIELEPPRAEFIFVTSCSLKDSAFALF